MSLETVATAVRWLRESDLLGSKLEILWHAGEPLLAGLPFYRAAHDLISGEIPATTEWSFVFQTNGTLVNDEWATFFAEVGAEIGISLDGPEEWHDARRTNWARHGTFATTMRGIALLNQHDVPFSTVTVLSAAALDDPVRLYEFLRGVGAETMGFNDEEKEGAHTSSEQYASPRAEERTRQFYSELYDLAARDDTFDSLREISRSLEAVYHLHRVRASGRVRPCINSQMNDAFRIVSVAFDGGLSTFSPELLGHAVDGVGQFIFGNVHEDTLADVLARRSYQAAARLIRSGVQQCRHSCEYFDLCGGGSPSNKYFENGRLDSSRTMFCTLSIISPVEAVLEKLQEERHVDG